MKVLAIGGATIDTIVSIADDHIERMMLRNAGVAYLLLEVGRKTEAEDLSVHCGGGAVNASVAFSRLGKETSALVKLGRDFRADLILTRLAAEGISTRFVVRDERSPTGASVLVSAHDSNTAVVTFRGANTRLTVADLDDVAFAVDLVYVASLSDASADCFPEIVARANAAGTFVVANPGIRQLSTRQDAFCATLPHIDILSVNRHEASALVPWLSTLSVADGAQQQNPTDLDGMPDLVGGAVPGGEWTMSLAAFFAKLTTVGPPMVVVTDSENGAYIGTRSGVTHCPALPVEIVGTAGAGDAFNATFAAFILGGASVGEAATAAAINSASVISHLDTQTGLLNGDELATQIAAQRDHLQIRHWPSIETASGRVVPHR